MAARAQRTWQDQPAAPGRGLSVPESGRITWGGCRFAKRLGMAQRMVYVAHASALKDDLSVIESLRFLARMHGRDDRADALQAALHRVSLGARRDALVRTLSQGQRRRATLARLALEREASLWILDEPYDALDSDGIERQHAVCASTWRVAAACC